MGSNLAIEHIGEPWFVDEKGLDARLQRWGMVLMLGFFTVCVGTQTSTAIDSLIRIKLVWSLICKNWAAALGSLHLALSLYLFYFGLWTTNTTMSASSADPERLNCSLKDVTPPGKVGNPD